MVRPDTDKGDQLTESLAKSYDVENERFSSSTIFLVPFAEVSFDDFTFISRLLEMLMAIFPERPYEGPPYTSCSKIE